MQGERRVEDGVRKPRSVLEPTVGDGGLLEQLDRAHRVSEIAIDDSGVGLQQSLEALVDRPLFGERLTVAFERCSKGAELLQSHPLVEEGKPALG